MFPFPWGSLNLRQSPKSSLGPQNHREYQIGSCFGFPPKVELDPRTWLQVAYLGGGQRGSEAREWAGGKAGYGMHALGGYLWAIGIQPLGTLGTWNLPSTERWASGHRLLAPQCLSSLHFRVAPYYAKP